MEEQEGGRYGWKEREEDKRGIEGRGGTEADR